MQICWISLTLVENLNKSSHQNLAWTLALSESRQKSLWNWSQIVRDKFDKHRASIEMLSKGPAEMQKNLPSSGGIKGSATVTKLKNLMEEVETIKAERWVL